MPRLPDAEPEPFPAWEPVPLELPLDDPFRRAPSPAGGEHQPADEDEHGQVIVIDLAVGLAMGGGGAVEIDIA